MSDRLTVMQLLPALGAGGAERSALEIGAALVAAGHCSIVVAADGLLRPAFERTGSQVILRPIGAKHPRTLAEIGRLGELVDREKVSIVHARSRLPAWVGLAALRMLPKARRPRFMTTAHGLNSPGYYSSVMARGERVICVSNTVAAHLARHYPALPADRRVVIHRAVDIAALRAEAAADPAPFANWPQSADGPVLLLPARGTRLKGHADAIAVLARVRDQGLPASLVLLGVAEPRRSSYVAQLRQTATRHGVDSHVIFAPPVASAAAAIAAADLVLQLSIRPEALGRTVLEALALGTPVVGYGHGGVGEVLAELSPASSVAVGDQDAVARQVLQILKHRRAAAASIELPQKYQLATMQARTLALYQALAT